MRVRVSWAQSRWPGLGFCWSSASPAEPAKGGRVQEPGTNVQGRGGRSQGQAGQGDGLANGGASPGPGRGYRGPWGDGTGPLTLLGTGRPRRTGATFSPLPRSVDGASLVPVVTVATRVNSAHRLPCAGGVGLTVFSLTATNKQQPLRPTASLIQAELQFLLRRYFRDCRDSQGTISALLGCV